MPLTRGELCKRGGLSSRQVGRYTVLGIIRGALRHGPGAPYDDDDLVRILATQTLLARGGDLPQISRMLYAMPDTEVYALAGVPLPVTATAEGKTEVVQAPTAPTDTRALGGDAWTRIELLPDLELFVRTQSSPMVQRIAREIITQYAHKIPPAG